jgi:hypothetical protein
MSDNRSERNHTPHRDGGNYGNENYNQSSPRYPPKIPRDIIKTPICADNNDYNEIIDDVDYDNVNDSQPPCFSPPLLSNSPIQLQKSITNTETQEISPQDKYRVKSPANSYPFGNNSGVSPGNSYSSGIYIPCYYV